MPTEQIPDRRAPMAAASMKYNDDGSADWGHMWQSFCVLALEGGPPHRGDMLQVQISPDVNSPTYRLAIAEIKRGIQEVSGLEATVAAPGWMAVACTSPEMAHWLAGAIVAENVAAWAEGVTLFVPVGECYSVTGEIKNVITAVAKTSHYWQEHLPREVKQALWLQLRWQQLKKRVKRRFSRNPTSITPSAWA